MNKYDLLGNQQDELNEELNNIKSQTKELAEQKKKNIATKDCRT